MLPHKKRGIDVVSNRSLMPYQTEPSPKVKIVNVLGPAEFEDACLSKAELGQVMPAQEKLCSCTRSAPTSWWICFKEVDMSERNQFEMSLMLPENKRHELTHERPFSTITNR